MSAYSSAVFTLLTEISLVIQPASATPGSNEPSSPRIVVRWNQAAVQGIRESTLGPPMISRALAIVDKCIYGAGAVYDGRAIPVRTDRKLRAVWDAKRQYDSSRQITVLPFLFQGQTIRAPFPEFTSCHSAFSAAGGSRYEPGAPPAAPVTLQWPFSDAANEAGMSRRPGGIHFDSGDLAGRAVGRADAEAWKRASYFWEGGHKMARTED